MLWRRKLTVNPATLWVPVPLCALILMNRPGKHLFLSLLWSCLTVKILQPCGSTMSNKFFLWSSEELWSFQLTGWITFPGLTCLWNEVDTAGERAGFCDCFISVRSRLCSHFLAVVWFSAFCVEKLDTKMVTVCGAHWDKGGGMQESTKTYQIKTFAWWKTFYWTKGLCIRYLLKLALPYNFISCLQGLKASN